MIVVDTSAWIEQLRSTGSPVHRTLRRLLESGADVAVTEVVVMELLAGARFELELARIRRVIRGFPVLSLNGVEGFEAAAALFQTCRRAGETIRRLTDCLVAVPAIEADATLLQADRDFEVLARHTPLRLEPLAA